MRNAHLNSNPDFKPNFNSSVKRETTQLKQLETFGLNPSQWQAISLTRTHRAQPTCIQNREEPSLRLKLTWIQTALGPRISTVQLMPF